MKQRFQKLSYLQLASCLAVVSTLLTATVGNAIAFPKPPVHSPLKILIVGDSLTVGGFGEGLSAFMDKNSKSLNFVYASFGYVGATPKSWSEGHKTTNKNMFRKYGNWTEKITATEREKINLDLLLGYDEEGFLKPNERPDVVVVQLGTYLAKKYT